MSNYQRRHYEDIARILKGLRPLAHMYYVTADHEYRRDEIKQWIRTRDELSDLFADDNEMFDRYKFDKASGGELT